MGSPYSTEKLRWHPSVVGALRLGTTSPLVAVQWMPELRCTHQCQFCAYGHQPPRESNRMNVAWRNEELMSDASMPWEMASACLADWHAMGVQGIELTGGGEPLMWPHIELALQEIAVRGIPVSLVTHGCLLSERILRRWAACDWRWVRVSIDAGDAETYMRVRRVARTQWDRAWASVASFAAERDRRASPECRVGVGYVVDSHNAAGVYDACQRAVLAGADNIRISLVFSPRPRVSAAQLAEATRQAERAASDFTGRIAVHSLLSERAQDIASTQNYDTCAQQHHTCVVGGDGAVYRCCTQAFTSRGLVGLLSDYGGSFRRLWESAAPERRQHSPRRACQEMCLYRQRNLVALDLVAGRREMAGDGEPKPLHVEWP